MVVFLTVGRFGRYRHILFHKPESALYVTTTLCPLKHRENFQNQGIDIFVTQPWEGKVHLLELSQYLSNQNILQVMIEGGPTLQTAYIKANLAHAIVLYIGGKILGDQRKNIFGDLGLQLSSSRKLLLKSSEILGNSLKTFWEFV